MMNKQESTVYLKGYTVHQVEHEILGKYFQAYVGTVRALEYAVEGDFKNVNSSLDWVQENLDAVKDSFPDVWLQGARKGAFEEALGRARKAFGELEKKLETKDTGE